MALPPSNSRVHSGGGRGERRRADDAPRDGSAERRAALLHVADLVRVRARVEVGRLVGDLRVGDRQLQAIAEDAQLVLAQLLGLVRDVATLHAAAQGPALDRLGEDHRGGAAELRGCLVGREHLVVVVAAAAQVQDVVVGQVLDEPPQARIRTEEVVAHVGARGHRVLLELAVDGRVHLLDEHAVHVAGEQVVPLAAPDHLDHVPAGAAEQALQLLDDLAVAAHRAVEALQVAVDDEGEVVEALTGGQRDAGDRLGLVHLAVAEVGPDALRGRVPDAAVVQVAVEPGLVDGGQRAEAHRDRRELPEVRHEPGVRVRAQALAAGLAPVVVEVRLGQAPLEEGAGVDAGRRVALEEDLVAAAGVVLAAEEVVEAHLVQGRRRGVGRHVPADAREAHVRAQDHRHGVPADQPADAALQLLVAREPGLLLRADRVDVARLREGRHADLELAGPLEQLEHEEPRAVLARLVQDLVQRLEPLPGLGLVDVGQLLLEVVDVHRGSVGTRATVCRRRSKG